MWETRSNMITRIDNFIRDEVEEYGDRLFAAVLLVISLIIRIVLVPKTNWSPDYLSCLEPWVEEYRALGFVKGLGTAIGNYYIPYNIVLALASLVPVRACYPLAAVSCVFEYLMVLYAGKILAWLGKKEQGAADMRRVLFAAMLILYLPPVILNGAFWKQCDAIYSAFALMAFYELLREKYYRSFWLLSLAFVFKLQVILILPVFLIAYFCGKKYSILLWLRLPVTYLEAGLPALLCGRSARDVYGIYFRQSDQYHYMFMNTGGLYRLLRSDYSALSQAAVFATMGFLVFMFAYIYNRREKVGDRELFLTAAVTSYGCFLFLPAMHERYDYLAVVLATLYYAYYDRKKLYIPAAIVIVTSVMYHAYLFGGNTLPEEAYAIICLAAFAMMVMELVRLLGAKKGEVENADKDK